MQIRRREEKEDKMDISQKNIAHEGLNGNGLKLIAIFAMTADHIADLFWPGWPCRPLPIVLHTIGRLTAPIMWFFIAEGYCHTKNFKRYLGRLGLFALISHFAYCFAFGINYIPFSDGSFFNQTGVMYSLFVSALVLWLADKGKEKIGARPSFLLIAVLIISAFPANFSCVAPLAVYALWDNRGNVKRQGFFILLWTAVYGAVGFVFVNKLYGLLAPAAVLCYPLLKRYNGQKGKSGFLKWFFYIYYPRHLVLLGFARLALYGDVPLIF